MKDILKTYLNKHESCFGIVLFRSAIRFVQVWFCAAGYTIESHSHPHEDIELMFVFGSTTFFRQVDGQTQSFTPKWYHVGRRFTVSAGTVHWFTVSKWPLVFINFSRFKDGYKPVSAAIDFQPTTT